MCHVCVTEAVKRRMLSRRDMFKAAPVAAVGAVAAAGTLAAATRPALAAAEGRVVDMTHTLSPEFPTYGGVPGISLDKQYDFGSDGYNLYQLTIDEHTGTHIDAPLHFSADGSSVDEIAPENLVCPLCVVDIQEKAVSDADAMLTPDDLKAWIDANGPIPDGACVAMNSGWAAHAASDKFRGADDAGTQHYPGFHVEAVTMLIEETGAACIAVDTLSLDPGNSATFDTHYTWLPSGRYGIECIANLSEMPATGATLMVGAPKHKAGTGGPARVLALV